MAFRHSLKHAVHGLVIAFRSEPNVRWQVITAISVIVLGLFFSLGRGEWALIILAIALVLILELINTALEKMLDVINPRFSEPVGRIKDIFAAAVLVASIAATVCGALIFLPRLF